MKIALVSVVKGFALKKAVISHIEQREDLDILDLGVHRTETFAKYNEIARLAAAALQRGDVDRAILFCGTGMGMAIAANKFRGVRAACCESVFAAEMSRRVNNANALTLGEGILAPDMACRMVDAWLDTKFQDAPAPQDILDFWQEAVTDLDRLGSECAL